MRVVERIAELAAVLDDERCAGRTVGVVPTMGALHAGHAALVERAAAECDTVVVTVFVNPLQFGPGEDLAAYPRDLDGDVVVAEKAGAAIVFAPPVEEMYPGEVLTTVHVAALSDVLEGRSRPTHFDGVATVVTKLFAIVGRCRAYFGEKDYQQLQVVRRLVSDLSLPVDVVGHATVRDHDGVALSSRNAYLTAEQRAAAPVLFTALRSGAAAIVAGERDPDAVRDLMAGIVAAEPQAELDSVDVVDATTLCRPDVVAGTIRLLVAARFGRARLIDNLGVTVPAARTDSEETS